MSDSYSHSYNSPTRRCIMCGGLLARRNQNTVKMKICYVCKKDVDSLPDEFKCKGIKKSGEKCRVITSQGYCTHHKHQAGEEE